MEVIEQIVFWGLLYVMVVWRCFTVVLLCKEVVNKSVEKSFLLTHLVTVVAFFLITFFVFDGGIRNITQLIWGLSFLFAGFWHLYWIGKNCADNNENRSE